MNTDEAAACPCADDWTAIEARFQRAKQTLLEAQQRHCDAAHEFLLARAQVRQMLEAVFPGSPGAEAAPSRSVPGTGGGRAAARQPGIRPKHT